LYNVLLYLIVIILYSISSFHRISIFRNPKLPYITCIYRRNWIFYIYTYTNNKLSIENNICYLTPLSLVLVDFLSFLYPRMNLVSCMVVQSRLIMQMSHKIIGMSYEFSNHCDRLKMGNKICRDRIICYRNK